VRHDLAVPYTDFFVGSVTVAGALTGLLFVALSVSQGQEGDAGSLERQAVAATAFTALVDSLWVSLVALLPGHDVQVVSIALGLLGLTSTVSLTLRMWRSRSGQRFTRRWPVLLPLIAAMYGAQTITAALSASPRAAESQGAMFVMIFFAVGIARSWELLGVKAGGILDLVSGAAVRRESPDRAGVPAAPGHAAGAPAAVPGAGPHGAEVPVRAADAAPAPPGAEDG